MIERIALLTWQHNLWAYDGLNLSAALTWKELLGEGVVFACFDQRLHQAAMAEKLNTWPDL